MNARRVIRALGLACGLLVLASVAAAAPPEADAAFAAGLAAAKAGDLTAAAAQWEQALARYIATPGDDLGRATCLLSLGAAYRGLGDMPRAQARLAEALPLLRRSPGTERRQAVCLQNLAFVATDLHQPQDALTYAQQALALFAGQPGMEWEQARCLRTMTDAATRLGRPREVVEWARQALALLAHVDGAERDRFGCLLALGAAYGDLGQHQQEAQTTEQALDLARRLPDSAWEQAACLQNLGVAYGRLGDLTRKLALTRQALDLFRALPTARLKQAECLQNLGTTCLALGQTQDALACTTEALAVYRQHPDTAARQAACLLNLGAIYCEQGDFARELATETEALALLRQLPQSASQQAECLANLGTTALALGRTEDGFAWLREAEARLRALARELGTAEAPWLPETLVLTEAGLGKAHALRRAEGDPERAFVRFAAALRLLDRLRTEAASAPELRARFFGRLAWIYDDTIAALLELRNVAPVPGPRLTAPQAELSGLWEDLHLPAPDLWPGWGSVDEAVLHVSEASRARVLRDLLASDPGATAGGELAALNAAVAEERRLADQLAAAPAAPALRAQLVEAGRRRLQAEMAWGRTALAQVAEPPPLRLSDVQALLGPGDALVEYKLLPTRLVTLIVTRAGLRTLVQNVPRATPATTDADLQGRLQRLQLAAGAAAGLPAGTRLPLEPDRLRAEFGVDELVRLYRRPMEELSSADERVRARALSDQAQQIRLGAALYDVLLRPVEAIGARALLVVPDGALYYLPFGSLVARLPASADAAPEGNVWAAPGVQFALERWTISHLPSASIYAVRRQLSASRPPPSRRLCALGYADFGGATADASAPLTRGTAPGPGGALPRLPGTRQEAESALRAFAGKRAVAADEPQQAQWGSHVALVSAAASEAALKTPQMSDYGVLLLATHGVIHPTAAALSYVALTASPDGAQDGRLYLNEALGLHLNARVVTLSGCRTAQGSFARGEGLLGLTAAFWVAGAQAITASLWTVADDSAAGVMAEYHRRLAEGDSPAAALRAGQLAVLRAARAPHTQTARLAHPREWGAFVVLGR